MALWRQLLSFLGLLFFFLGFLPNCALASTENGGLTARDQGDAQVPFAAPVAQDAVPTMVSGSTCASEGQWNCLTTCWQRCASGVWSDAMALAPGTECNPAGLTYDLQIADSGSSSETGNSHIRASLAMVLSVTTGPCPCILSSTSTACPSSGSSSSSSTSSNENSSSSSSSVGDAGGFVSGSSAAAGTGPAGGRGSGLSVAVVVGVGTLAVVFARLLM